MSNLSHELEIEKSASQIFQEHIEYLTSNAGRGAEAPVIFELDKMLERLIKPYKAVFKNRGVTFSCKFGEKHNRLIGIKNELSNAILCILNDTLHSTYNAESDGEAESMEVTLTVSEKPVNNSATVLRFELCRNFGLYDKSVGDIVQKYMKLLNGTIENKNENGRILSSITVPLEIAPDTASAAYTHEPEKVYNFSGMTALVADNNELNLAIMSELLKDVGFETICVRNGQQAVYAFNRAMKNDIDLIIMDSEMPIMDAYIAAHTIRKSMHANHDTVPIIVTLAHTHLSRQLDEEKCKKSGITTHISNSMNTDELYYTIESCFTDGSN